MLAKVLTGTTIGVDSALVEVEADISQGLPRFDVVGLPDAAVQEAASASAPPSKTAGLHFRTGIPTHGEHTILDEGVIRALVHLG